MRTLAAHGQYRVAVWLTLAMTALVPNVGSCGSAEQPAEQTTQQPVVVKIKTAPQTVEKTPVTIVGTATPGAKIDAGSVETVANLNGGWALSLPLRPGRNDLTVAASHADFSTAYDSVSITRRRTASEAAAFERSRAKKRADAERRKSENRAKARAERREKERREAARARPSKDDLFTMNLEVSRYLSALLDNPYSADPSAAIGAVQSLLARAEGACEDALLGFSDQLGDTSGDPDRIRARVLDANYEVAASCESS